MTTQSLAAALVIALTCVLSASCLRQSSEVDATASPAPTTERGSEPSGPEPIGEAPQEMARTQYGSKNFPFVTEIKDDGKDEAGGWQRSQFTIYLRVWEDVVVLVYQYPCQIEVGMPLRSVTAGRITASRASLMTADVANLVVPEVLESRDDHWEHLGVLFCKELREKMQSTFRMDFPGYGVTVGPHR